MLPYHQFNTHNLHNFGHFDLPDGYGQNQGFGHVYDHGYEYGHHGDSLYDHQPHHYYEMMMNDWPDHTDYLHNHLDQSLIDFDHNMKF